MKNIIDSFNKNYTVFVNNLIKILVLHLIVKVKNLSLITSFKLLLCTQILLSL